ncbi:hypothetical protein D9758_005064 [Tetrapyrgos nigripes]|uniref:60S ribosomal protein L37 n=1 Tax=Tetrapyrgos nigripes TaxID=182062 RepID=A0A8H5GVT5_9AGAR|nr:hypothetical protein D9758_005064 [Tetrapyrgos nigripes]
MSWILEDFGGREDGLLVGGLDEVGLEILGKGSLSALKGLLAGRWLLGWVESVHHVAFAVGDIRPIFAFYKSLKLTKLVVSATPSRTLSAGAAETVLSTDNTKSECDTRMLEVLVVPGISGTPMLSSISHAHASAAHFPLFFPCAQCGYPSAKLRSYEWGQKAKRRKTTGTGRMKYLKHVSRRFKNGFRENTAATKRVKASSTEA